MFKVIKHFVQRFMHPHQWDVGECAKVWCHSVNSGSRLMYVMIIGTNGDYVTLEYLQKEEIEHLRKRDPSWWFITEFHKRELKRLSYSQMDRCVELIYENRQKEYHNQK